MGNDKTNKEVSIIIGHRGWVWVGFSSFEENENPLKSKVVLTNAKCVRKWGTENGLGEIAIDGPTSNTILDDGGTIKLHPMSVIASYDCDYDKWKSYLVPRKK